MGEFPRIEPLGEGALLVRFGDRLDAAVNAEAVAFRAWVAEAGPAGVAEAASSLGSVLAVLADGADADAVEAGLRAGLAEGAWRGRPVAGRRRWAIPCAYGGADGPELAEAAAMAGLSEADAVAALAGAEVAVLALGFAPGMPYLGILPDRWDLPRRTSLTARVPEGALVVAVRQMVLFGTEAPTGWRRVGRTAFGCFRPGRDRPVALAPGDVVTFPAVDAATLDRLRRDDPEAMGGATWEPLP